MCFIVFDWQPEARRLTLAANRDEFYARPTAPAQPWEAHPEVLAGRDLRGGGTWMGVTADGRWAALTNVREPGRHRNDAPSRGALVADFLRGTTTPESYARAVAARGAAYNGFNLLLGAVNDGQAALWYVSNRCAEPRPLHAGRYGISNACLDTPWPKVVRGKAHLARALEDMADADDALVARLLRALADDARAPDDALPDTGVGLAWERLLSPIHIASETYGTRASTVLRITDGRVTFVEQTHGADGHDGPPRRYAFDVGTPVVSG